MSQNSQKEWAAARYLENGTVVSRNRPVEKLAVHGQRFVGSKRDCIRPTSEGLDPNGSNYETVTSDFAVADHDVIEHRAIRFYRPCCTTSRSTADHGIALGTVA